MNKIERVFRDASKDVWKIVFCDSVATIPFVILSLLFPKILDIPFRAISGTIFCLMQIGFQKHTYFFVFLGMFFLAIKFILSILLKRNKKAPCVVTTLLYAIDLVFLIFFYITAEIPFEQIPLVICLFLLTLFVYSIVIISMLFKIRIKGKDNQEGRLIEVRSNSE